MSISSVMSTALSGMRSEQTRLARAADTIANAGTAPVPETSGSSGGSGDDLLSGMMDLLSAETGFAANATVFETGADLWDVLMSIKRD